MELPLNLGNEAEINIVPGGEPIEVPPYQPQTVYRLPGLMVNPRLPYSPVTTQNGNLLGETALYRVNGTIPSYEFKPLPYYRAVNISLPRNAVPKRIMYDAVLSKYVVLLTMVNRQGQLLGDVVYYPERISFEV